VEEPHLPIWVRYMGEVLRTVPESPPIMPGGVSMVRVDPKTGMSVSGDSGAPEFFFQEFAPGAQTPAAPVPN
jgi:penicillin-binding protein 1A